MKLRAACALAAFLLACGDDGVPEPAPVEPELQRDVHAIQDVMATDPATGVLAEIDLQVEDERPIRASEMIRDAAVPAARRQVARTQAVQLRTTQGRELLRRVTDAYRRRIPALERYGRALARGVVEDLELVEAMGAQREIEMELVDLHDELARIRPLAEERPVRGVRDRRHRPEGDGE